MKKRPSPPPRSLSFEPLEPRLPLAGNVAIAVSGGNLKITGDGGDNNVSIVQTAPGNFTITGGDGEIFRLKGRAASEDPVNVTGVIKNITINLKGGADVVEIEGLGADVALCQKLTINTGAGDDDVKLFTAKITGNLSINMGNATVMRYRDYGYTYTIRGTDGVTIDSVNVVGKATLKTGTGDDFVMVSDFNAKAVNVAMGAGDDSVSLDGPVKVTAKSTVKGGAGLNSFDNPENLAAESVALVKLSGFDPPDEDEDEGEFEF